MKTLSSWLALWLLSRASAVSPSFSTGGLSEIQEDGILNDMMFDDELDEQALLVHTPDRRGTVRGIETSEALQHHRQLHRERNQRRRRLEDSDYSLPLGRDLFWQRWETMEETKQQLSMWSNVSDDSDGRKTLSSMHYLILPSLWSDPDANTNPIDPAQVHFVMTLVEDQYADQSWGKHQLSWEILEQVTFNLTRPDATYDNAKKYGEEVIRSLGYVQDTDYTGHMSVTYKVDSESSDINFGGGLAAVNGRFLWMSYAIGVAVTRHEVGHNYGHPHHYTYTMAWRNRYTNGGKTDGRIFDGFDMMSGGNGYAKSDFGAPSKWWFNWIPNEAVVMMQPEGPTVDCTGCKSSVSGLVLKAFDDVNVVPSHQNIMAVQIPIIGLADTNRFYSYWLTYRGSGNDGLAAIGLSMHLVWFNVGGKDAFAATYNQLRIDAFGDTGSSTKDSFVLPNTCYVIDPPVVLRDLDFASADAIRPIVCVDDLSEGHNITVSVSFLDQEDPPNATQALENDLDIACLSGGTTSVYHLNAADGNHHMLHYEGTGTLGEITGSMCLDAPEPGNASLPTTVTAYFYDAYPYAYMTKHSPAPYGALQSVQLTASVLSDCSSGGSNGTVEFDFSSEFGETFVLLVPDNTGVIAGANTAALFFNSKCVVTTCLTGQYMSGGACVECPDGSVSESGATSSSDCTPCAEIGRVKEHFRSSSCVEATKPEYSLLDNSFTSWRLWTHNGYTSVWWALDITWIKFYESVDCSEGSLLNTTLMTFIDSGNAGDFWSPDRAFRENNRWGGRRDDNKDFWIGFTLDEPVQAKCVYVRMPENNYASKFLIQVETSAGQWETVWISQDDLVGGDEGNFIQLSGTRPPTPAPFDNPTAMPSTLEPSAPTPSPTPQPTSTSVPTSGLVMSTAWRVWTPAGQPNMDHASRWNVQVLRFFSKFDCSFDSLIDGITDDTTTLLDSGNGGWGPSRALYGSANNFWAGRADENDEFYLGFQLDEEHSGVTVQCVTLKQQTDNGASMVNVQYMMANGDWMTAFQGLDLKNGTNTFTDPAFTPQPTPLPTSVPTFKPSSGTDRPTNKPTELPEGQTNSPTPAPTVDIKQCQKKVLKKCTCLTSNSKKRCDKLRTKLDQWTCGPLQPKTRKGGRIVRRPNGCACVRVGYVDCAIRTLGRKQYCGGLTMRQEDRIVAKQQEIVDSKKGICGAK